MVERFDQQEQRIEWIPVKKLSVIWVQSQRRYYPTRAQKIADNFDPDRCDPIRVTLPNGNGEYHIVDGQHRRHAVDILWGGDQCAPCIILKAEDPAEAAKLFDGINGTRWGVDPISRFKVRVTAKEPTEVAVNKIVEHRGYKIGASKSEGERAGRYISSVGALIAVFTMHGPKVLDDVLQIVSATWPSDPYATNSSIIRGYGALLNEFGSKVNWGRLTEVIKTKFTPGSLVTHAKDQQHVSGGAMGDAVLKVLIMRYNKGCPEAKKLKRGAKHEA